MVTPNFELGASVYPRGVDEALRIELGARVMSFIDEGVQPNLDSNVLVLPKDQDLQLGNRQI